MNKYINYITSKNNSKYSKWYCNIISNSFNRNLDSYYEKHHIVPKCIVPKWSNELENISNLTPREHYICHLLLTKIFKNNKKLLSSIFMLSERSHKKNSILYEKKRILWSQKMKENNPMRKKEHSLKVSKKLKGRNKNTHEYINVSALKKSKTMKDKNGLYQKIGRKKIQKWLDSLTSTERKKIFGHKVTDYQKNKLSLDRKGKSKKDCQRVKKMSETKKLYYDNLSETERKIIMGKTKGMSWYHNDELKKNKLFLPNNVTFEWSKGRKKYEN